MEIYNHESMKNFVKWSRKIVKVILCMVLFFSALIWLFCGYLFIYEIENPHIMGSDNVFLKLYYKVKGDVDGKLMIAGVQPFTTELKWKYLFITGATHSSTAGTTSGITLSYITGEQYNLVVDTSKLLSMIDDEQSFFAGNIKNNGEPLKSTIIEFRFRNTTLLIKNFIFYNPNFKRFLDPFQTIDYRHYGLRSQWAYSGYRGDFCLAFYSSHIIHIARKQDFPDCHLIITPNPIDYPYTILETALSPVDTTVPATMEVVYHHI